MRDWMKGALVAAILIAPAFGPMEPDRFTASENAVHWMIALAVIALIVTLLLIWGARDIDYKARNIAKRNADIADANKLIEALEDARINAHVAGDEGHSKFLLGEIGDARANILHWQRQIREIQSGLDPERNVTDW